MNRLALIALLGAAGALARLGITNLVPHRTFPWSTLVINVAGSFALGVLVTWGATRVSADVASGLGIGFLGAFTTFSTFTVEASLLGDDGQYPAATIYALGSVALGIAAAIAGILVGRSVLDA